MASNNGYNVSIYSPVLTLSNPPPAGDYNYGYQMAIKLATAGSLRLDPKGCIIDGRYDCITACYNPLVAPGMLWNDQNSMHTLANCLVAPVIIDLAASGDLDSDGMSNAAQFGLTNNTLYGTSSDLAWKAINNCTVAYCKSQQVAGDSDSNCDLASSMYASATYATDEAIDSTATYTLRFNATLCDANDVSIDPEIGGIGMVASYMTQIFIALITWAYVRTAYAWIEYVFIIWAMLRQASTWSSLSFKAPPVQKAIKQGKQAAEKFQGWHLSKTLVTALVDFQKTQVLFILAVQISCLWAANNGEVTLSSSYGQEQNNLALYEVIGLNGAIPVVMTLSALHAARQDSLYIDIASLVSLAISSATCLSRPPFSSLYRFDDPEVGGIAQCGGLESPLRYCTARPDKTLFFDAKAQLYIWLVPFITGLCFALKRAINVFRDHHGDPAQRQLDREAPQHPLWTLLLNVVEIVLAVGCCYLLGAYFQILLPNDYPAAYDVASIFGAVQWTPGQVISITIWAPIVIDFVYNLLMGFEKGFAYKLVKPYAVINGDGDGGISIFSHEPRGSMAHENRNSLLHEAKNGMVHHNRNGFLQGNPYSIDHEYSHGAYHNGENNNRNGMVEEDRYPTFHRNRYSRVCDDGHSNDEINVMPSHNNEVQ